MNGKKNIGVLALQGAFGEHTASLQKLGAEASALHLPGDLGHRLARRL